MFVERKGLIVWMRVLSNLKHIHNNGNVYYISKRFKYVLMYCDACDIKLTVAKLLKLRNVVKVEYSNIAEIKEQFQLE